MARSDQPGELRLAEGRIDIYHRGKPLVQGATAWARYRAAGQDHTLALERPAAIGAKERKTTLSVRDERLELVWEVGASASASGGSGSAATSASGGHLRLRATNRSHAPIELIAFAPFALESHRGAELKFGQPRHWVFFQNGYQSWSPTFARRVSDGLSIDPGTEAYRRQNEPYPVPAHPKTLVSQLFTVLNSKRGGLLLGFLGAAEQFSEVRLALEGNRFHSLIAYSYADGVPLAPGQSHASEELWVRAGDDPLELLEDYARRLGERMGARIPPASPTGWCSWYYFFGENTARDVLANLEAAQRRALPLEWILIDDGYQRAIGDWTAIDEGKYPEGMRVLAERIAASGRRPGIWLSPFGVSAQSSLFAQHPDWLLRDQAGHPRVAWEHYSVPIYALDLTHPAVLSWLREVFGRLRREWGFQVFKIDFLYAGAVPGRRYDPSLTRAQALRMGLQAVRQAIGEEAYLLGCGAPLAVSIGIVDGMRIGPDVAPHWRPIWADLSAPAAANALRNSVARYFMHGRWWANDPDCVLVRPRGQDCRLTLDQMRTLVTLVGLSGGAVLDGDNLPDLDKGRLNYLRAITPPYPKAATPRDLFERELPEILHLPIQAAAGAWHLVALINWGEHTRETVLRLGDLGLRAGRGYHLYNFWRRHYEGIVRDKLRIWPHRPQETVLLLLKPVATRPQLLTSTFHLTQGAVEVARLERLRTGKEESLVVELEKAGVRFGELLFSVPDPYHVGEARVKGRRQRPRRVASGIIALGFTLKDRARVELIFHRD